MNPRAREHRFRRLKEMGCICCRKECRDYVFPEIHHLNLGGHAGQKRRGDEFTIPLCRWHHQGGVPEMRGPSLKWSPRVFRERYGSDDRLLKIVNRLIYKMDAVAYRHRSEALRNDSNT